MVRVGAVPIPMSPRSRPRRGRPVPPVSAVPPRTTSATARGRRPPRWNGSCPTLSGRSSTWAPAPARSPASWWIGPTRSSPWNPTTACGPCSSSRSPACGHWRAAASRCRCPTPAPTPSSPRRRGTGWTPYPRCTRSVGSWSPAACWPRMWSGPDPESPFMAGAQALLGAAGRRPSTSRSAGAGRRDQRPVGHGQALEIPTGRPLRSARADGRHLGRRPERRRAGRPARRRSAG